MSGKYRIIGARRGNEGFRLGRSGYEIGAIGRMV